jgi:hypothetical protein
MSKIPDEVLLPFSRNGWPTGWTATWLAFLLGTVLGAAKWARHSWKC